MDQIPLFNPDPVEISCSCQDVLPAGVVEGLRLFNSGEYFRAHEVLEDVWREEKRPIRELYRGILQVAVAYYHLNRGNLIGARKMFRRSQVWLRVFPDTCQGINLAQFRHDFEAVKALVERFRPGQIIEFDHSLLKPIEFEVTQEP
jgi:predicted metal-dependent hydrolase